MDAGKRLHEHHANAEVARLHGGVLAGAALPVIAVAHHEGRHTGRLVGAGHRRHFASGAVQLVDHRVGGAPKGVDRTGQGVVGDVVEVTAEAKPRTGHGNVVRGALARRLDQEAHAVQVLSIPRLKRSQQLQALAVVLDDDLDTASVFGRGQVTSVLHIEALLRQLVARGLRQLDRSVRPRQGVGHRVEGQVTRQGDGGHDLRRAHESVGIGVAVRALGEVAVEAVHDAVLLLLLGTAPGPLADAGTASVGEDISAHLVEGVEHTIALEGIADKLGSRGDGQLALALDTGPDGGGGKGRTARDVLVAGVRARTDQAVFNLGGISLLGTELSHLAHRGGEVRAERTVEVRLKGAQVNLDDLVEVLLGVGVDLSISGQVLGNAIGELRHIGAARGPQVTGHALVVAKRGGRGANLRTHVADGALSGAAHGVCALAEVLDDAAGSALHGQDASHLQDDILGAGPTAHFAGQLDTDQLGELELPWHAGHDVHGVGSAHTNGDHAEAARIHGVAVRSDHHAAGEGVVLQHHLVNDAGARLPEPDAVFVRHGLEEIVDFVVAVDGLLEIGIGPHLGLDQVVTVHRGRHRRLGLSRLHELQQGHLGRRVLHGHAVRSEIHVVRASGEGGLGRSVPQVGVEDFLGQRQGFSGGLTGGSDTGGEALIHGADHIQIKHLESVGALGRRR